MYDWINKCYSMEQGLKDKNEDCLLFNARFNKDNQYKIETNYKGEKQIHLCFKLENQYHISKGTSILEDYITKINKAMTKLERIQIVMEYYRQKGVNKEKINNIYRSYLKTL